MEFSWSRKCTFYVYSYLLKLMCYFLFFNALFEMFVLKACTYFYLQYKVTANYINVIRFFTLFWYSQKQFSFFDVHTSVLRKYISKVQPKRCNFFSIYFYKLLYMFQAVPPPIIRSTGAAIVDEMELAFHLIHDSSRQQNWFYNTWRCMYNFVLLMMGGGTAWNT